MKALEVGLSLAPFLTVSLRSVRVVGDLVDKADLLVCVRGRLPPWRQAVSWHATSVL